MFLIRFFRFISGYIVFTGKGGFPERFINLCSMNGIPLWDAKASCGILQAKTSIKGYKKIRTCARKSGLRISIKTKCGLPFIVAPYLKRKGLFAGVVFSLVLLILLTSTVWTVDVSGNEKFTREQIIAIAEKYGIHQGAFRNGINLKEIRSAVKAEVNGISWFSVNIDGSHVTLQVSETDGSTEIIDNDKPCNIISDIDGEVLKIEAQKGTPAVLSGNAVTKGDLLISGVTEKNDGSVSFSHARGTAIIRTKYVFSVEIPLTIDTEIISQIKEVHTLTVFGIELPTAFKPNMYHIRNISKFITYNKKALPVGIISDSYASYKRKQIDLSVTMANMLASYITFRNEKNIMLNALPEAKIIDTNLTSNKIEINSEHIIHKTTGIEHYFEVVD